MSWFVIWTIAILALLGAVFSALRQKMPIAIALTLVGFAATLVLIAQD